MPNIYEIKKSKFISYIFDIKEKEDVKKIITKLKNEHKKAKHVVYAYILDLNNIKSGGYSDDKEPQGVAGKPLYKLLENKKITNKIILIVRYFGGIELGKSNLLRSYLTSAKMEIDEYVSKNQK
ncbi:YigZ family protein [Metamycoplasma buccale]|uniref:YigZ family protein n=1 Tax=Metamycoplasma buccale TaxID=55602 RepID=UPI00398ECCD2